jgi:subtilisin family serine protease/subtilisin-like proprotein convertase family protein
MIRREVLLLSFLLGTSLSLFAGPYAPSPNDPYFTNQWNLEDRSVNGDRRGIDLNVREAWPMSRGAGVVIAIVDNGVDLAHRDLQSQAEPALHFNFALHTAEGGPLTENDNHGTSVAGMAVAPANNGIGIAGVAPEAHFASWYIYNTNQSGAGFVGPDQLAEMFQFESNRVAIQNHSWVINNTLRTVGPSPQERAAISNAITFGREGKGVIMVRAAGNDRFDVRNANDDAYSSDPRVITVAAIGSGGKVANYSNAGAPILVSAPSGGNDPAYQELISTDRSGSDVGFNNTIIFPGTDLSDYVFTSAFGGTSAAAPEISGLVALLLSVNPELTYRDVQQILVNSSKQWDISDPDLVRNGAGYLVGHNTGFGMPDAAWAVRIAQHWSNRPPLTRISATSSESRAIATNGLRLLVTAPPGASLPSNLAAIPSIPSVGIHADEDTLSLPLVDVGLATNEINIDLHGKAALIQRGINSFLEKIQRAAQAGAAVAIIYNNTGQTALLLMPGTDSAPIPAVFITQNHGAALRDFIKANPGTTGLLHLDKTVYSFDVTETLQCEHVGVSLHIDHPIRADLRITLVSPSGTRSILQTMNIDQTPFPENGWTYYTTHHFYESSAGTWRVEVSDEGREKPGRVKQVDLTIEGVRIIDSDHDGLDDNWERANFGDLSQGGADDPDLDGYRNAREQVLGTNPTVDETPFQLDMSRWNERVVRLSWLSSTAHRYDVMGASELGKPMTLLTNVSGEFPETEFYLPSVTPALRFFQVIRK